MRRWFMPGDGYKPVFGGRVVSAMRTYHVRVFIPQVIEIEATDEAHVLEKVGELYKEFYTKDLRTLIEPEIQPEDSR
jgi:hypothetical protein